MYYNNPEEVFNIVKQNVEENLIFAIESSDPVKYYNKFSMDVKLHNYFMNNINL